MTKIDFKGEWKHLFKPSSKEFEMVEVPGMNFILVDGHGDPNTAESYLQAVEALYAAAYKIKFRSKKNLERDYVVPPLEGLWWAEDMDSLTAARDKSTWDWTMMIMQPEWVGEEVLESVRPEVMKSKYLPALPLVRWERFHEGLCVQILHIGSFDDEGPTIHRLHAEFLPENNLVESGKHHEVYLSDPRKTAPEKLKTILRQPVKRLPG